MPISAYYKGHGRKVMRSMRKTYGDPKKAKQVFYATANARGMAADMSLDFPTPADAEVALVELHSEGIRATSSIIPGTKGPAIRLTWDPTPSRSMRKQYGSERMNDERSECARCGKETSRLVSTPHGRVCEACAIKMGVRRDPRDRARDAKLSVLAAARVPHILQPGSGTRTERLFGPTAGRNPVARLPRPFNLFGAYMNLDTDRIMSDEEARQHLRTYDSADAGLKVAPVAKTVPVSKAKHVKDLRGRLHAALDKCMDAIRGRDAHKLPPIKLEKSWHGVPHPDEWNKLKIANEREAEIATEYGDGTQFKPGDVVLHNHRAGKYKAADSDHRARMHRALDSMMDRRALRALMTSRGQFGNLEQVGDDFEQEGFGEGSGPSQPYHDMRG